MSQTSESDSSDLANRLKQSHSLKSIEAYSAHPMSFLYGVILSAMSLIGLLLHAAADVLANDDAERQCYRGLCPAPRISEPR